MRRGSLRLAVALVALSLAACVETGRPSAAPDYATKAAEASAADSALQIVATEKGLTNPRLWVDPQGCAHVMGEIDGETWIEPLKGESGDAICELS